LGAPVNAKQRGLCNAATFRGDGHKPVQTQSDSNVREITLRYGDHNIQRAILWVGLSNRKRCDALWRHQAGGRRRYRCHSVKDYLDSRGPQHRIVFLVDEVGQFIGNDSHLMLNLQTITEELGTICRRRAWVVVTSQEDMDTVLGDMSKAKKQDFSAHS